MDVPAQTKTKTNSDDSPEKILRMIRTVVWCTRARCTPSKRRFKNKTKNKGLYNVRPLLPSPVYSVFPLSSPHCYFFRVGVFQSCIRLRHSYVEIITPHRNLLSVSGNTTVPLRVGQYYSTSPCRAILQYPSASPTNTPYSRATTATSLKTTNNSTRGAMKMRVLNTRVRTNVCNIIFPVPECHNSLTYPKCLHLAIRVAGTSWRGRSLWRTARLGVSPRRQRPSRSLIW